MLIVNALIEKQHFAESAQPLIANVCLVCLCVCVCMLEGERQGEKEEGRKRVKRRNGVPEFICAYICVKMYFGRTLY